MSRSRDEAPDGPSLDDGEFIPNDDFPDYIVNNSTDTDARFLLSHLFVNGMGFGISILVLFRSFFLLQHGFQALLDWRTIFLRAFSFLSWLVLLLAFGAQSSVERTAYSDQIAHASTVGVVVAGFLVDSIVITRFSSIMSRGRLGLVGRIAYVLSVLAKNGAQLYYAHLLDYSEKHLLGKPIPVYDDVMLYITISCMFAMYILITVLTVWCTIERAKYVAYQQNQDCLKRLYRGPLNHRNCPSLGSGIPGGWEQSFMSESERTESPYNTSRSSSFFSFFRRSDSDKANASFLNIRGRQRSRKATANDGKGLRRPKKGPLTALAIRTAFGEMRLFYLIGLHGLLGASMMIVFPAYNLRVFELASLFSALVVAWGDSREGHQDQINREVSKELFEQRQEILRTLPSDQDYPDQKRTQVRHSHTDTRIDDGKGYESDDTTRTRTRQSTGGSQQQFTSSGIAGLERSSRTEVQLAGRPANWGDEEHSRSCTRVQKERRTSQPTYSSPSTSIVTGGKPTRNKARTQSQPVIAKTTAQGRRNSTMIGAPTVRRVSMPTPHVQPEMPPRVPMPIPVTGVVPEDPASLVIIREATDRSAADPAFQSAVDVSSTTFVRQQNLPNTTVIPVAPPETGYISDLRKNNLSKSAPPGKFKTTPAVAVERVDERQPLHSGSALVKSPDFKPGQVKMPEPVVPPTPTAEDAQVRLEQARSLMVAQTRPRPPSTPPGVRMPDPRC